MSRSVRKGGWRSLALAGLAAVCGGCSAARLAGGSGSALACTCGRVTALTSGPGNDTEAAWSPDGSRVAFQTDAAGDLDIAAVEVGSRRQSTLVGGAGNACYPAWTPGGGLVYSFGNLRETAMQAASRGSSEGYGLRIWEAAGSRILTQGLWRDYTPCVARDGKAVYFASTRDSVENSASLWRLSFDSGATAERVVSVDGASVGAAQPSLSRDGRYIVWAQLDGFRQNWRLYAARVANPQEAVCLTPGEMSAYAPRWSPDGRVIAFTGFCAGDPGWGVFLLEPCSGCRVRLETGPGNSRSPDWSPDGRELVFENNRGGLYKLYRMPVSVRVTSEHEAHASVALVPPREEARLVRSGGEVALVGAGGARVSSKGGWPCVFERPAGLDFGAGPFYVKVTLRVDTKPKDTRIAAVGHYAEHALGWQVFLRSDGKISFSSREPDGRYVGVESDEAVKVGKPVTVVGVRDADGTLRMSVDGVMQKRRGSGAKLSYGPALSVCLGQQWNGGMRLEGRVEAFECGRGTPAGVPRVLTRGQLFAEVAP